MRVLLALGFAVTLSCEAPLDLGEELPCAAASRCQGDAGVACVDLQRDPSHCGGCGVRCPTRPNAAPTCAGGQCGIVCHQGFGDCDQLVEDGCEASLVASSRRCGACGTRCAPEEACAHGRCALANLSIGRTTAQSSTFTDGCNRDGRFAVDGRWCGVRVEYGGEECSDGMCRDVSATRSEQGAWWEVDLGAPHNISHVEIWENQPPPEFVVESSLDHVMWTAHAVTLSSVIPPVSASVGQPGRWVRIRLIGFGALWLREVLVAGDP